MKDSCLYIDAYWEIAMFLFDIPVEREWLPEQSQCEHPHDSENSVFDMPEDDAPCDFNWGTWVFSDDGVLWPKMRIAEENSSE